MWSRGACNADTACFSIEKEIGWHKLWGNGGPKQFSGLHALVRI